MENKSISDVIELNNYQEVGKDVPLTRFIQTTELSCKKSVKLFKLAVLYPILKYGEFNSFIYRYSNSIMMMMMSQLLIFEMYIFKIKCSFLTQIEGKMFVASSFNIDHYFYTINNWTNILSY